MCFCHSYQHPHLADYARQKQDGTGRLTASCYLLLMEQSDFSFRTRDGLTLRGTRYGNHGPAAVPVFCLPGLTRNERDFTALAGWLAGTGAGTHCLDVYCLSFRGRGRSDRDATYLNYQPLTYVQDVIAMAKALDIDSAVFIGTSLGGIVTMLTAHKKPSLVRAGVLNDIGPDLAPEGLARIAGYVGGSASFDSWKDAASAMKEINAVAFPAEAGDDGFWLAFAERCCREEDGKIILDYDPNIALALQEAGHAPDLWDAFTSMSCPVLSVLGGISDLFTPEIQGDMKSRLPHLQTVTIPQVGHAPTLDEPAARDAIGAFLAAL